MLITVRALRVKKYKMNLKGLYHVDTAVLDQICAELITENLYP